MAVLSLLLILTTTATAKLECDSGVGVVLLTSHRGSISRLPGPPPPPCGMGLWWLFKVVFPNCARKLSLRVLVVSLGFVCPNCVLWLLCVSQLFP